MTNTSLEKLLNAIARGDARAFRELYEGTAGKLFGIAVRIVKRTDLAEDVVQDTYLKIWDGAARYRPEAGAPLAWMVAMTRNRAIDLLRKRTEHPLDENADDVVDDGNMPDPFSHAAQSSALRAFLACLQQLEPAHQRCLLMAYYYGYTHDEIAAQLSAPVGTVKSRIRRGLARIRECLDNG